MADETVDWLDLSICYVKGYIVYEEQLNIDTMAYGGDGDGELIPASLRIDWDPTKTNWEPLPDRAIRRVKSDLDHLQNEKCWGIFAVPDEYNIGKVHLLIIGPEGTPYYGGFFHFLVMFPPSYPSQPPKVKILNTDGGRVRFNPNLYANGKVCLSIIGTWPGPSWTPTMNLMTIAVSIQSLMGDEPLFNEPGIYKHDTSLESSQLSDKYNAQLRHEVLRVAVLQFLKNYSFSVDVPDLFRKCALEMFPEFYSAYMDSCDTYEAVYRRTESLTESRIPRGIFSASYVDFPSLRLLLENTAQELAPDSINRQLTEYVDSDQPDRTVEGESSCSPPPMPSSSSMSMTSDSLLLAPPEEDG